MPLRDLNLKLGLLLAGIVRQNGQIVIPSGNDVLHLHDDVIVTTPDTSGIFRDIAGEVISSELSNDRRTIGASSLFAVGSTVLFMAVALRG